MGLQTIPEDDLTLISRLRFEPSFSLAYLQAVLQADDSAEIERALARFYLAFDGTAVPPLLRDPVEARFALERLRRYFADELREINLT